MRRASRTAFVAWAAVSLLVGASVCLIRLRLGSEGLATFIQQPPLINLPVTLASVALLWGSAGVLTYLLQSERITSGNLFTVAGFFLVCWVYLNVLSERWRYGDYAYYWESAVSMFRDVPLNSTYFYPPLFATVLQYLVPSGEDTFFIVLWLLDFISFIAFYFLLHRVLEKYGFGPRFAAAATTIFMLANTTLLRTLVYVQVNLHALNFILLALLLYPRHSLLSALMLALAVHLKGSPAVVALAFLLERDGRWLAWFGACLVLLAGVTVLTDGLRPFVDVLQNWRALALSGNTIYHDTSFDSFVRSTAPFLGLNIVWSLILIYAAKVILAAGAILTMLRSIRSSQFTKRRGAGSRLLNAAPPLLILMTLAAPVVWEHHGIFVGLSFVLMLKRLETPHEWLWFGFAYMLEFLLPTFDFYPWSFGRLVAPLIILWQMWRLAGREGDGMQFKTLNTWFENLPGLRLAT
jgi:hypothetical protein